MNDKYFFYTCFPEPSKEKAERLIIAMAKRIDKKKWWQGMAYEKAGIRYFLMFI